MNEQQELAHLHAPSSDPKQRMIDYWGQRCEKAEDENGRLKKAVERMGIGVNHIALYRTDAWPPYETEPLDALEKLGAGREYDMWCCWHAAMCARDSLL